MSDATEKNNGTDETEGTDEAVKTIQISARLHALLVSKKKASGQSLKHMVETALWELVRPEPVQLELVQSEDSKG